MKGSPYAIKNHMRIRFYLGASEILGRVVPLESEEMKPGEEGYAELRMEGPVLAERGDRFVLRTFSPMRTIAGGVVLDVSGAHRRRFRREEIDALRLIEEGSIEERIAGAIAASGRRGDHAGRSPEENRPGRFGRHGGAHGDPGSRESRAGSDGISWSSAAPSISRVRGWRRSSIEQQKRQPLSWGLSKSELKSRLERQVSPELIDIWIQERERAGELFIRDDRLRFGEEKVALSPAHAALRERILAAIAGRGFSAPTAKELLEAIGAPPGAEELLNHLQREGEIVKIPPDLLFGAGAIVEMRTRILEHFSREREMSVASLKEILGVSRKQAVPLLEWMDRQRWTERSGDVRTEGKQLRELDP